MAMSENTRKVLDYLKGIGDENVTANDIAEELGLSSKQVNGIVTSGLQRKELAERVPATVEVEDEDGQKVSKAVKFIKLTAAGKSFDPDAADAE